MRIDLSNEQKLHHLEEALPEAPLATKTVAIRNAYTRRVVEQQEVACLMLVSMTPEIQKNLEDRTAFDILQELKTMFQQQAEQELEGYAQESSGCPSYKARSYPETQTVSSGQGKEQEQEVSSLSQAWILEEELSSLFGRGLRGIQKLNKGALDLYVGNDNRAVVEAIGSFDLILLSEMVLVLENYHFAPSITRGVISLSRLWDNGFLYNFTDYGAISQQEIQAQLGFYFSMAFSSWPYKQETHCKVATRWAS
ncbi:hypothetical protein Tco_1221906 [Tanacetum coccineum]